MNPATFREYLSLLRELTKTLEQLTEIQQKKTKAVQRDELAILNECMKQEQAMSLRLRGFEQKQQAALNALQLTGVPLSRLAEHAPEDCILEARETAQELRSQYEQFSGAFEVAQNTLECNLHEVEGILESLGALPGEGTGFPDGGPELPPKMRTDFRA